MFPSRLSLSEHDLQLFLVPPHIPPLHLPPRGDNLSPPNPRTAGLFGRLAIQSPPTGCKPNAIVEISSTDAAMSASVSLEVDERQSIERLAPPLLMQKREKQVHSLRECISLQEFYVTLITLQAQGKQLRHTHSNGSRAETQEAHSRNISQVKMNNKKLEFFVKCRGIRSSPRRLKLYPDSRQRNLIQKHCLKREGIRHSQGKNLRYLCMSQGRNDQRMPAKNWAFVPNMLNHCRHQEYETFRREHTWLRAELQSLEQTQPDDRVRTSPEMDGLKEKCCSKSERTQGKRADDFSLETMRSCTRAHPPTVTACAHLFF